MVGGRCPSVFAEGAQIAKSGSDTAVRPPQKTLLSCHVAARLNTRSRVKWRHFVFTAAF